jgi:signal transduction histidine kinase
MTYRLVALMSVVLLLCLATFAVATRHYQDEVMDELTTTVSTVGRAAFSSLESDPPFTFRAREVRATDTFVEKDGEQALHYIQREDQRLEDGRVLRIVREFNLPEAGMDDPSGSGSVFIHSFGTVEAAPIDGEPPDPGQVAGVLAVQGDGAETIHTQLIWLDAIRAETEPGAGIVLRVPTTIRENVSSDTTTVDVQVDADHLEHLPGTPPDQHVHGAEAEEIRLPIPTRDYEALFAGFRWRSMGLFLGIFAVGLVLTTGLASRFTRPIRRLDSGIRRLSEGNLDVEVPVRGKDEIARLGRAFNDMTRKLRAGRERERDLTRREKLSALGRLAAGVAHDVRNPLHSIGLTLQNLHETCRPDDETRAAEFDRSLEIIREDISRLDRLVENFLRFARTNHQQRDAVDLGALVEETARLVSKEAEWRGITVKIDREPAATVVEGDPESIRSSVLNLVLNSFEAMPDGGTLTLAVGRQDDTVRLEVADTGVGIPEEDHERVFEFAYSTRQDGSGLGLAMVHHCVVEEHGGRLDLESGPGQGTLVRLIFPVDARSEERS